MYQHDFILLDKSGSMQGLWTESLSAINAYVKKLANDRVNTGVTVVVFDSGYRAELRFEVIRDRILPEAFKPISVEDARPDGGTPLSDASVKLVNLAERGNYDKVAIIIVTDGDENSSTQYSVADAKAALDRCRAKDWAVTFLGADFQNDRQATSYGNHSGNTAYIKAGNFESTFTTLGLKRGLYASAAVGTAAHDTMSWTQSEKDDAAK